MPDARLQRCRESYAPPPLRWYDVNRCTEAEALAVLRHNRPGCFIPMPPAGSYGEVRYTGPPPAMWLSRGERQRIDDFS